MAHERKRELLEASDGNPCVKTGCCAVIANTYYSGDLFDLGKYYMLNCSQPGMAMRHSDQLMIHLLAYTWTSTHQGGKVVLVAKEDVEWVVYDARWHPEEMRSA